MPKYDFYTHPPTTKVQVHEYITTWLEPVTDPTPVVVNGTHFRPTLGFRRGSAIHTVYQNQSTGEFVWYVAEDSVTDYTGWPFISYSNLNELVTYIVEDHCRRWGIQVN